MSEAINSQAAVAKLHAQYCTLTGRPVPCRNYERAWFELLRCPEYECDGERLWADVEHLVRYLQRGIREGKRNAGALKLANFLQPDRFFDDVAESKVEMRPRRGPRPETAQTRALPDGSKVTVLAPAPEDLDVPRLNVAAELRKFADGLKGGQ